MAIDRAATLRHAEELLREGKLDSAIVQYLRVVEEQPNDWKSANTLGDLFLRTGQGDKAVDQFVRVAGHLKREGFLPKAAAIYKKILRIHPGDEHALLQAGEIAAVQGLLVDARLYLTTVAERRLAGGDQTGAWEIRVQLGALDPADFEARRSGARARIELGDVPGAVRDFKDIAAGLAEQGRHAEAIDVLREGAQLNADDPELREQLANMHVSMGDSEGARAWAATPAEPDPTPVHVTASPVDLESASGEAELSPAPTLVPTALADSSVAVGGLGEDARLPATVPPADQAPIDARNLDEVFAHLRAEVLSGSAHDLAEQAYERSIALREAGRMEESIEALRAAASGPRQRFRAAAALGRFHRERGALQEAIEWFEQAAKAPPPSPDEAHALFYELADALEAGGERARALALCLELRAGAGEYRDVSVRISRLSRR